MQSISTDLGTLFAWLVRLAALMVLIAGPGSQAAPGQVGTGAKASGSRAAKGVCERLASLCTSPEVIYVGASASGRAPKLLAGSYELRPLPPDFNRSPPGHVIVGIADLDRAAIGQQLRIAYRMGYTVAVTDALPTGVGRLRAALASSSGCSTSAPSRPATLAGFQRSSAPGPAILSGFLTLSQDGLGADPNEQSELDSGERRYLAARFGNAPPTPVGLGTDDQCPSTENCLVKLSAATTCSLYDSEAVVGPNNTQVNTAQYEVNNSVWSLRSFDNQEDFYFVAQNHELTLAKPAAYAGFVQRIKNDLKTGIGGPAPGLLNPSPGTTNFTTTYTSGLQQTFGGSLGMSGGEKSGNVTFSAAISNSTSFTMLETVVSNDADIQDGDTKWQYGVSSTTETSTSFVNYWIWSYPRSGYGAQQSGIDFSTTGTLGIPLAQQVTSETTFATLTNVVPLPFGTWTPAAPVVSGITQNGQPTTTIKAGTSFEINGTGLYPATIQDVLLGGQVVNMPYAASDTEITVVAPGSGVPLGTPIAVVVRTTQGFSNSNVAVTIQPD